LIVIFFASFIIRILGTLFPAIFQSSFIAKAAITSHTFFAFMQLIFFVFISFYTKHRQYPLKFASLSAIIGSSAIFLVYLKNIDLVFQLDVLPQLLRHRYFDASIPLVSSILLLLFFGVYRIVLTDDEKIKLNRPILAAIIGVSIFLVLNLAVVINLIGYEAFGFSKQIPESASDFTILFTVVAAILILDFYFNFYNFLNWLDENEKK